MTRDVCSTNQRHDLSVQYIDNNIGLIYMLVIYFILQDQSMHYLVGKSGLH